jgi:hypothetical protein
MKIWTTPHWTLERVIGSTVVRMRRTAEPVTDAQAFEADFEAYQRAMPRAERATLSLLIDLRDGPLRNEPGFEAIIRRNQRQLVGGFRRYAVLVRTSVGRLQVTRQARESGRGGTTTIFQDEKEALAYLLAR